MRTGLRWLLLVIFVMLAAACESVAPAPTVTPPPTFTPTPVPTSTPQFTATPYFGRDVEASRSTASLRIIHAASQAPALDLSLDDLALVGSLGYGLASNTISALPGDYALTARSRGTNTQLAALSLTLTAGVMTDVIAVPAADGGIQLVAIDGPERAVQAGTAVVRAVNALTDVAAMDVSLNDAKTETPLAMGGSTGLLEFPEGDLVADFTANGVELLSNTLHVRALNDTLLILTGLAGRPQLLIFESPTLGLYSLRVVNLSPDAREIDVFFDESVVAANLPYQGITDRAVYSTAGEDLSVYAANADVTVSAPYLTGQRLTPRPGSDVLLAIYGPVSDLRAMWIEEDLSPVPVGQSRIAFAHVLTGVPSLQIGVNSTDLETIRPFAYGEVSQSVLFGEGESRVFIRDASRDGSVVEVHEAMAVPAGMSIIFFVTGDHGGEDVPPMTFAEPVEVDDTLSVQPVETPHGVYRVRYVNALVSQPDIDVSQDGTPVASRLAYTEVSPQTVTGGGSSFEVAASLSGSSATLLDLRFNLDSEGDYTVYIYGTPDAGINAVAIKDAALTSNSSFGTVRLVNLTQDQFAVFGLATVPVDPAIVRFTPVPTLVPSATPIGGPEVDPGLPRIPGGISVPIAGVGSGQASRVAGIQANSLIYVVNTNQEIIASLPLVAFAENTHTDIVVYQYRTPTSTNAIVFPLVYPPR